jgi:hypothetical protein
MWNCFLQHATLANPQRSPLEPRTDCPESQATLPRVTDRLDEDAVRKTGPPGGTGIRGEAGLTRSATNAAKTIGLPN